MQKRIRVFPLLCGALFGSALAWAQPIVNVAEGTIDSYMLSACGQTLTVTGWSKDRITTLTTPGGPTRVSITSRRRIEAQSEGGAHYRGTSLDRQTVLTYVNERVVWITTTRLTDGTGGPDIILQQITISTTGENGQIFINDRSIQAQCP
jgi:hypothetical protein